MTQSSLRHNALSCNGQRNAENNVSIIPIFPKTLHPSRAQRTTPKEQSHQNITISSIQQSQSNGITTPSLIRLCHWLTARDHTTLRMYQPSDKVQTKFALQEWRHWLEGAPQPFLVLTDHKNLEYLHTAKRLNPRQACWALFLTRFDFTLSYQPGSKNGKADALSCVESKENKTHSDETMLSPTCWVYTIEWDFDKELDNTLPYHTPSECKKRYVPPRLRSNISTWAQTSPASRHPDTQRTLELLKEEYYKSINMTHYALPALKPKHCDIFQWGNACHSGYHPWSNRENEQKIGRYLKTYCSDNQGDWARYLPWVEYAQNSLKHEPHSVSMCARFPATSFPLEHE